MGRWSDPRSFPTAHSALVAQVLLTVVTSGVRSSPVVRLTCVGSPLQRMLAFLEMSQSSNVSHLWLACRFSSQKEEWALRSPAANVNGPELILLRARESDEVGPFTGATHRLWIVAHLRRDSWICIVSLSRGGLQSSAARWKTMPSLTKVSRPPPRWVLGWSTRIEL